MMYIVCKNKRIEVRKCDSFKSKLLGLMFKRRPLYGVKLVNCNSIHTFFMRFKIDVFMTDKDGRILFIKKDMKCNRIIIPKRGVINTYEFPNKMVSFDIGDIIKENN